jgi:hypothetical protein
MSRRIRGSSAEKRYELVALTLQADRRQGLLGLPLALLSRDALDLEPERDVVEDRSVG